MDGETVWTYALEYTMLFASDVYNGFHTIVLHLNWQIKAYLFYETQSLSCRTAVRTNKRYAHLVEQQLINSRSLTGRYNP